MGPTDGVYGAAEACGMQTESGAENPLLNPGATPVQATKRIVGIFNRRVQSFVKIKKRHDILRETTKPRVDPCP